MMAGSKSRQLFETRKKQSLSGVDLSRKGSIDQPIQELIEYLNSMADYFTLSSCSGRVCVFEENEDGGTRKKGCRWLYTTHADCESSQVQASLQTSKADASLKFEPFVLHVQCCHLANAQALHAEAVAAGFRNSGITISKKRKIVVAVRSTHSMEIPVTHKGQIMVSSEYLEYVAELCNTKMKENHVRVHRFFDGVKTLDSRSTESSTKGSTNGKYDSSEFKHKSPNKKADTVANFQQTYLAKVGGHVSATATSTAPSSHKELDSKFASDSEHFDIVDCCSNLFHE